MQLLVSPFSQGKGGKGIIPATSENFTPALPRMKMSLEAITSSIPSGIDINEAVIQRGDFIKVTKVGSEVSASPQNKSKSGHSGHSNIIQKFLHKGSKRITQLFSKSQIKENRATDMNDCNRLPQINTSLDALKNIKIPVPSEQDVAIINDTEADIHISEFTEVASRTIASLHISPTCSHSNAIAKGLLLVEKDLVRLGVAALRLLQKGQPVITPKRVLCLESVQGDSRNFLCRFLSHF
jgi:hypothetical protein